MSFEEKKDFGGIIPLLSSFLELSTRPSHMINVQFAVSYGH